MEFQFFIAKVENNKKKEVERLKDKIKMRKKLKEKWIQKSKIMPPSLIKHRLDKPPQKIIIHSIQTAHERSSDPQLSPISRINTVHRARNTHQHSLKEVQDTATKCQSVHIPYRNIKTQNHKMSSWKLEFRRDQLNVIKFKDSEEQNSPKNLIKISNPVSFKLRKLPKKFGSINFQKLNRRIEEEEFQSRTKTQTTTMPQRLAMRMQLLNDSQ